MGRDYKGQERAKGIGATQTVKLKSERRKLGRDKQLGKALVNSWGETRRKQWGLE